MELIRKVEGEAGKVFGITSPLITKSDGSKFGKSEGKNIWLDPKRTSAYEFYQFWLNTPDADVVDYLKRLSFRSPEEITALEASLQEHPESGSAEGAGGRADPHRAWRRRTGQGAEDHGDLLPRQHHGSDPAGDAGRTCRCAEGYDR